VNASSKSPLAPARKFPRRKFLLGGLAALPVLAGVEACCLEPTWLKITRWQLPNPVGCRLVHFSDLHHKGDRAYLDAVVNRINALQPDVICFTGDLVEGREFLDDTLAALSRLQRPLFGVPGNHDYWSEISFATVRAAFARSGGAWLLDENQVVAGGRVNLIGKAGHSVTSPLPPALPGTRNILLLHYPAWANQLRGRTFDLLLAGHSHGGQVRIPFHGPLFLPFLVDKYDLGMFTTPAGPLYVNAGIGYLSRLHIRFNCRPEITVFEV